VVAAASTRIAVRRGEDDRIGAADPQRWYRYVRRRRKTRTLTLTLSREAGEGI
jgi:hypothetical protein